MKARLKHLLDRLFPKPPIVIELKKKRRFMDDNGEVFPSKEERNAAAVERLINTAVPRKLTSVRTVDTIGNVLTNDSSELVAATDSLHKMATGMDGFQQPQVPAMLADWYGAQSFIGSQLCAILAQNWLINKACVMPGEDAIRKGWTLSLNDGTKLTPEQLDYIVQRDIDLKVADNLREYIQFSRVFGIRLCMFVVDNDDKDYYTKPFNIDGVGQDKYKGMTQVDPYWVAPELDMAASANPLNKGFYTPTWWTTGGTRIHKSHLMTCVPNPVADVLKPTYFFGGVPLTQQIFERVYNAERCASEAVQLLQTKRANVMFADLEKMIANQGATEEKLQQWAYYRDNYSIKVLGEDERYEQHDTSLTDLDTTILTQYELVAAIAGIPSSKLLGHAPSGSLAQTGEGEEANYHQMLESLQSSELDPLLARHYELLCKSELEHKWSDLKGKNLVVKWQELDAMTENERCDANLKKAQTDQILRDIGAIDSQMAHDRIVKDKDSGYEGLADEVDELEDVSEEGVEQPDPTAGEKLPEQAIEQEARERKEGIGKSEEPADEDDTGEDSYDECLGEDGDGKEEYYIDSPSRGAHNIVHSKKDEVHHTTSTYKEAVQHIKSIGGKNTTAKVKAEWAKKAAEHEKRMGR